MNAKPVKMMTIIALYTQIADDAVTWAKNTTTEESRLSDFRAGVVAGAREMVSFLKLHGHLMVQVD